MVMFKNLVVVERKGLMVTPAIDSKSTGVFTVVTKSRSGFPTVSQVNADSAYKALRKFQLGSVLNVSMMSESGFQFTMYARSGKKIRISEEIARELRVGDINDGSVMHKTALYSQEQYRAVNSSSWDSKVFVVNK
tara:strand:+ start:1306 stop:1710 length:405 start_codon:yes stop_codon:yes gene_type:complete